MSGKLTNYDNVPLPQDLSEGVDESEWVSVINFFRKFEGQNLRGFSVTKAVISLLVMHVYVNKSHICHPPMLRRLLCIYCEI